MLYSISWRKYSRKIFKWAIWKKNPYFRWENLQPCFDIWNKYFHISYQWLCIQIFITLTWKIPHYMQKILCPSFHVGWAENSIFQVRKLVPRFVYVNNREFCISHSEICIRVFICETENFIFYVGLSHFRCLYLKQIIPSSRGTLVPIFLLSCGCCHWDN